MDSASVGPRLLFGADLAATFLFALEGAIAGVVADLDVFGVVVVAFVTAIAGGVIRDVLIGAVPPATLSSVSYPAVVAAGAVVVIVAYGIVDEIPSRAIAALDAAGLSLFAVVGSAKALEYGVSALLAALLGAMSAVGGGTATAVLLNEVPPVLRVEVYAVAALLGATVVVAAVWCGVGRPRAMALGAIVCFVLRIVADWRNWNLPTVHTG